MQVLQAQVEKLSRGEEELLASCSQSEEALAAEPCTSSMQEEQQLQQRLEELLARGLMCQPEENDQLDLLLETDGLRKSIHNLGTIVTTRSVQQQNQLGLRF